MRESNLEDIHFNSTICASSMAGIFQSVKYDEEYVLNSRGMKLFACSWVLEKKEVKALVFICHGYAMECSVTMSSTANRLAKAGYAVYGIDYEGHGKSAGLHGFINDFDYLVDDCTHHFTQVSEREENKGKLRYLLGESMGGAMALFMSNKKPNYWDGLVLVAPMCKIADEMKPSPILMTLLSQACKIIPTWSSFQGRDIVDLAFKETDVKQKIKENPYCYKGPVRLKTAYELLRVSTHLEQRLHEVSVPFLVLHGEEDKVTDQAISGQLYKVATSIDKSLKLYPDMWHGLLYGEPVENINVVFADIIKWLDERAGFGNSRSEWQRKLNNDKSFPKNTQQEAL